MRSDKQYLTNKERQKAYRDRKKANKIEIPVTLPVTKNVTKSVTPKKITAPKTQKLSWIKYQEFIKNNSKKTGGKRSNTLNVCALPVRHTDVKNWFIIFQTFLES